MIVCAGVKSSLGTGQDWGNECVPENREFDFLFLSPFNNLGAYLFIICTTIYIAGNLNFYFFLHERCDFPQLLKYSIALFLFHLFGFVVDKKD